MAIGESASAPEVAADAATDPVEAAAMRRSSRDHDHVRERLSAWLAARLPAGAHPEVSAIQGTSSTGMSSETLLFDASWHEDGMLRHERLVARVAPAAADVPVFPSYELDKQFEAMRIAGELTSVAVPEVRWFESDPSHLGTPFFVMGRVDGEVPPDMPPYTFGGNWLFDATPSDRRRLQDGAVAVLAELHAIDGAPTVFPFLEYPGGGDSALRRHFTNRREWYEFATGDGVRSPLLERGFAWLEDHWPADESPAVLSWGDSRIGNVMFRDFVPVAVLDWEMAGLAPREIDLAWMIHAHQVFQFMTESYGLPGLPDFMDQDDVATEYEALTGYTPRHLDFFVLYSAIQFGIVGQRTGRRSVHFGETTMPDDVDELMFNRAQIELLLDQASHR